MNRITTLFVGLLLASLSFAQQQKLKVDYDNDSRWFWGVNAGTTWSTADVAKKHDWGWGATLGKSFNYNYGKAVSFDIRGRFLHGEWYGQNGDTTGFAIPNQALSSGNTDYKSAYGFSILNFQTILNRASLELVLHANNLRAKTGWDLSIFGGIGYTWYRTKGDLINGQTDSIYRYDQLSSYSKGSAMDLLDGTYETALDGSTLSKYTGAWMPSVGIGIGYQLLPRFSIGLEHKTTFTLSDNFDGYINPNSKFKNDLYHYTSVYLRFQIRDHANYVEETDNSLGNVNNYDNTTQTNIPPVVDFRNPAASGTTVNTSTYVIRADIKNVAGANNVIFRQNGNYLSAFSFNPSTQSFEATVTLVPGQNIFELTGTNNYGSDNEQTVIIYNREQQNPPVVSFINPSVSPTTVSSPAFNLSASILNVTQPNQVSIVVNGQSFTAFSFANGVANGTLNLVVGTNIVTVTGTNQYGSDNESTTIIYSPQQTLEQRPVVYFVDPNVNPYTTSASMFTINADVLNVAGAQNITFKQNGSVNPNFTYNASTDRFQSTVVLNPGQNVFELIGTNTAGSAQATTIIIYERQAPKPPIVTITNPANNPQETASAFYTLGATVLNVTQQSQITVTLNGQAIPFSYTASNNGVTASLNLVQGSNTVVVTGTNSDGTDSKQTLLLYRPQQIVQPPVVTYSAPNVDPYTTEQQTYTVIATVLNVTAQSGVNVNFNGANVTNFAFNTATGMVTLPLSLIEGANVITITGTNTAGTASEPQTIIFRKPTPVQPPVVSFIDPAVNPTTVFNQTYNVSARVRFVTGAQQIALRINGQVSSNFTYSSSSELMSFTTGLVPGANIVEITATNSAGQDQESTTIIYREPNPTVPPVVTITNPLANPHTVSTGTAPIAATVLNVDGAQQIQVLVNNAPFNGFTYNATTKQVNFTMTLVSGANTLTITATNTAGTASDSRTINYRREQVQLPPVVTFINPATPGTTVNTAGFTLKARVQYVDQANQVTVSEDGQLISPALWNFNPATKEITFNTTLNAGNNVFTVTGTNAAGNNSGTTSVIYRIPVVVCDKPVLSITSPATPGTIVENNAANVQVTIQHITSANQVQLFVNGVLQSAGTFNTATNSYAKAVTLIEGQNSIELVATNSCGTTKATTTISYKPVAAPCKPPVAQRVDPQNGEVIVQTASINIKASVANVENANEISVLVNGTPVPFNYDNAAHFVTAAINLAEGENTVLVVVSTACGKANASWQIVRKACNAPAITLTSTTVENGATTFGGSLVLVTSVSGVTDNSQMTVTHNSQDIGFVYNAQTGALTIDRPLALGANIILIKAKNACGDKIFKFTATRREEPKKVPTIQITTPATTPFNTQQSGMTIQAATTNVTEAGQVSVTVNGVPVNVGFNATSGEVVFNTNFQVGANLIVATAVTPGGTATDAKTVIYTAPVVVDAPVITIKNPKTCPAIFNRGNVMVVGTVSNISSASQVTIMYNDVHVEFTSTIVNNTLTFSFPIAISAVTVNIPLVIAASNEGGKDSKTCLISFEGGTPGSSDTLNEAPGSGTGTEGNNGNGNGTGTEGTKQPAGNTTTPTPVKRPTPTTIGRP